MFLIPFSALRYCNSQFYFFLKHWKKFHFHPREIKKGILCSPWKGSQGLGSSTLSPCCHPLSTPQNDLLPTLPHISTSCLVLTTLPHNYCTASVGLSYPVCPLPSIPSELPEAHNCVLFLAEIPVPGTIPGIM